MLLGISSIDYLFRTTIPAGGLAILIGVYNQNTFGYLLLLDLEC